MNDCPRQNPAYRPAPALHPEGGGLQLWLANFCQDGQARDMSTMNISLPESMKTFVDEQVSQRGYSTSSEYVRELIRRDQERMQLRGLLLAGASSSPAVPLSRVFRPPGMWMRRSPTP
jgi:antitoxin ParD1/3/4